MFLHYLKFDFVYLMTFIDKPFICVTCHCSALIKLLFITSDKTLLSTSVSMLVFSSLLLLGITGSSLGVRPSPGCGKSLPAQPHPGHSHSFNVAVNDPNLGGVSINCVSHNKIGHVST